MSDAWRALTRLVTTIGAPLPPGPAEGAMFERVNDALRIVSEGVNAVAGPEMGVLVITHYNRILNYIKPHKVHVMKDGRMVTSGGPELALELEARGYDWVREEVGAE